MRVVNYHRCLVYYKSMLTTDIVSLIGVARVTG